MMFGLALVHVALLGDGAARAEDPASEKIEPPVKKTAPQFLDRRALQIPGRVPDLVPVPQPPKAQPLPALQPPSDATPAPTGGSAAPALAAPVGAPAEGGDLKKVVEGNCRPLRSTDRIMFEFKDAEIKDVVTLISKTMCRNFIITAKVRSQKFDIISPKEITIDEAWLAFLSALEASDLAVFQVGRYYKIASSQSENTHIPVPVLDSADRISPNDRYLTKIYRLQYVNDPNTVVNYLNNFKSTRGAIHPYVPTNTIIVTDYAAAIARLERILDELDAPGVSERIHVVPVQYATAQEIAQKLNEIFEPQKAAQPGGKVPIGKKVPKTQTVKGRHSGASVETIADGYGLTKILADDRTNTLIIVASDDTFREIMSLKKRLDVRSDAGEGQVHVLRLKHANADELATTLASLASGKPTSPRASRVGAAGKPGAAAPPPVPAAGGAPGGQIALFQGEVKVTADKPTNSLVITASKVDYESMKAVINSLDVPRLQVFVEAVIMEVAINRDRKLGVGWHGGVMTRPDGKDAPLVFGFQPKDFSSLAITAQPALLTQITGLAGAWKGPPVPGTEGIVPGGIPALGVIVQALQSDTDVNVVSTPHLLTMDNEEAEIQVNEKRRFSSGISLSGAAAAAAGAGAGAAGAIPGIANLLSPQLNISPEEIGLTLKLKPQINDQEYVRLEIHQELSDVVPTLDPLTGQPITSKRSAKTVVVVRDQDSIVIGGLVRSRESKSEAKVPLLGDLPLLGWLFRRQEKGADKVNLILVLTPYIIRGPQDFYGIYQRKMRERQEFVTRYYGDTPEYRASMDWNKKVGALASYRKEIRAELMKAENGGPGAEGEEVIRSGGGRDDDASRGATKTGIESHEVTPEVRGRVGEEASATPAEPSDETPPVAPQPAEVPAPPPVLRPESRELESEQPERFPEPELAPDIP